MGQKQNSQFIQFNLCLPKKLEKDKKDKPILSMLKKQLKPLQKDSNYLVPSFTLNQPLINALYSARRSGWLIRGLESAEKKLASEKKGIDHVKPGDSGNERVSRLVVIANNGSDRFYRQAQRLIDRYSPRLLAISFDVTSEKLGEKLFGSGQKVLLLLLSHKEAVANTLLSLKSIDDSETSKF